MRHPVRAAAADVLRHGDLGVFDLILAGKPAQLQCRLDDLIDACRADRMAARLETAHCSDRQPAGAGGLGPRRGRRDRGVGKPR